MHVLSKVVIALLSISTVASAEEEQRRLAEVDLIVVINADPVFETELNELKSDVRKQESEFVREFKELRDSEELETGKSGHDREERMLALREREINLQKRKLAKRKKLLEEEAGIYHRAFQRARKAIESFARTKNIIAVRSKSKKRIRKNNSKQHAVPAMLNHRAIYIDRNVNAIDITDEIVDALSNDS